MMKRKSLLTTCCALMLLGTGLNAADRWGHESGDKFGAQEANMDMFGTWADRDRFGEDTAHGGGGLGFNFFQSRNFGLGVDSYIEEWKLPYRANVSAILRLPTQSGIAPYGFGGGGRQWKYVPQWSWHAGGGLEFRFNPHTGLFADGRRVFPEDTEDYTLVRAGLRLGF
jgi:hypothetical protein